MHNVLSIRQKVPDPAAGIEIDHHALPQPFVVVDSSSTEIACLVPSQIEWKSPLSCGTYDTEAIMNSSRHKFRTFRPLADLLEARGLASSLSLTAELTSLVDPGRDASVPVLASRDRRA